MSEAQAKEGLIHYGVYLVSRSILLMYRIDEEKLDPGTIVFNFYADDDEAQEIFNYINTGWQLHVVC